MTRSFIVTLYLCLVSLCPLAAGTFYLYIEEECNGTAGNFLPAAREGIVDVFFTDGHIIFDDLSDRGTGGRIATGDLLLPLAAARQGGAEYLIAVRIESTAVEEKGLPENLSGTGLFFIYEVGTGRLVGKGRTALDNAGREEELDRDRFGFEFGTRIAVEIERLLS